MCVYTSATVGEMDDGKMYSCYLLHPSRKGRQVVMVGTMTGAVAKGWVRDSSAAEDFTFEEIE